MKKAAIGFALVTLVSLAIPAAWASAGGTGRTISGHLDRAATWLDLASARLRETVISMRAGASIPAGIQRIGSLVRVEVVLDGEPRPVIAHILAAGGSIEGQVPGSLVQALVPFDRLVDIENLDGVGYLRPPLAAAAPQDAPAVGRNGPLQGGVVGEEVAKTNADEWHSDGWTGSGVAIGVIDSFNGGLWSAAQAGGEVPAPAGTFCQRAGAACDIWQGGIGHGESVVEIIHEMAPGADVYIASAGDGSTPGTASDLQAAVSYFASQGVDIISRSETAEYDGPGDGTGPIATVIDSAVAQGMTWFNSVGNSANAYWRGSWQDANGNSWLDWAPGVELLEFDCSFVNGLRWSDWGSGRTDYDLAIADTVSDAVAGVWKVTSVDDQSIGAAPLEHVNAGLSCGTNDFDYAAVYLYTAGSGTVGDALEFMTNGAGVQIGTGAYSATGPAADSRSAGAVAVGAIDPATGTTIAEYSSMGPTNDGRIKPDISAASCVASYTWDGCFNGSSAAAPVVAGAAALVLESGQASSPSALKTYLSTQASVDRGTGGPDNMYGAGELILPGSTGGDGGSCTFQGYGGSSIISGTGGDDDLIGTRGDDLICAQGGDDVIYGKGGDDILLGGGGNDIIDGGGGHDYMDGLHGFDYISYADSHLSIRLSYVSNKARGDGKDSFFGFEGFLGSPQDDDVEGSNGANVLWGNDGDDILRGFGGNDTIEGGDGDDNLYGGQGNDTMRGQRGFDLCFGGGGNHDRYATCELRG